MPAVPFLLNEMIYRKKDEAMKHNVTHRLIAIALAALMTASLASCSDNGGTASTGGSESTGGDAASTADDGGASTGETTELYWFSDVTGWGPATANWTTDTSPAIDYPLSTT